MTAQRNNNTGEGTVFSSRSTCSSTPSSRNSSRTSLITSSITDLYSLGYEEASTKRKGKENTFSLVCLLKMTFILCYKKQHKSGMINVYQLGLTFTYTLWHSEICFIGRHQSLLVFHSCCNSMYNRPRHNTLNLALLNMHTLVQYVNVWCI